MIKKLLKTIGVEQVGLLELLVALYPILTAYPMYIGLLCVILVAIIKTARGGKPVFFKALLYYLIFYVIHGVLLMIVMDTTPGYFINRYIVTIISLLLVFFIGPTLNYKKFYGSMMLVGLMCMIGLLYHFIKIFVFSSNVTPILLPISNTFAGGPPMLYESSRPSSFFIEPAAYTAFMMIVLAMSVIEKKWFMAVIITLSVLLSTSTNGFAQVMVFWAVILFAKGKGKVINILFGIALFAIGLYFVLNSGFFDYGLQKISNTDFSDDVRLTSGLNLFSDISLDYKILGIPEASVYDFLKNNLGVISRDYVISISEDGVYLPSFWQNAMELGIIGLFLYVWCFLSFLKCKPLRPYIVVSIVAMFSQSLLMFMPMVCMLAIYTKIQNVDFTAFNNRKQIA